MQQVHEDENSYWDILCKQPYLRDMYVVSKIYTPGLDMQTSFAAKGAVKNRCFLIVSGCCYKMATK